MSERHPLPPGWPSALIGLGLLWLVIGGLYRHTLGVMVAIWSSSDTYAHGFVVPLISLWLIWRIRHDILALTPRPSPTAWVLLLGAAILWFAGDLVAVNVVTQLALVLLVIFTVPSVLGWQVTRRMAFPLGFLLFAVPIGDFMLPQLMVWTADFTVLALRVSGIPVYREGLQFVIPSGSWSVVEACSGIRYLIASLTVGCLFAYLSYRSLAKRWIFVGVAILVPLLANWLRAYMIVMIGHLSGNELATGVDHLIYGWVFFGIVIMAMLMIGARWADTDPQLTPHSAADDTTKIDLPTIIVSTGQKGISLPLSTMTVLCILVIPHVMGLALVQGNKLGDVALILPEAQTPWNRSAVPSIPWAPTFKNASKIANVEYTGPGVERVGVHVSYYRQQNYERKLVSSENTLVSSKDGKWVRMASDSTNIEIDGSMLTVTSMVLREQHGVLAGESPRLRVWRFYWVNKTFTANDVKAKLHGAFAQLKGQGDDGAIVVLYTPMSAQEPQDQARESADAVLQSFIRSHGMVLESALLEAEADSGR